MNEKKKSLFVLHISGLLFGGTGLFAKLIDLPVIDITAVRALIASAGLFILLKMTWGRRYLARGYRTDIPCWISCSVGRSGMTGLRSTQGSETYLMWVVPMLEEKRMVVMLPIVPLCSYLQEEAFTSTRPSIWRGIDRMSGLREPI